MTSFDHNYSRLLFNKKIGIIGIVPPPLGGVSVHIERVIHVFKKQSNSVSFFNAEWRYRNWLFPWYLMKLSMFVLLNRFDYLYYHASYTRTSAFEIAWLALLSQICRSKLVFVEHDCRHMYLRAKREKQLYRWAFKCMHQVIFIGESSYESYKELHASIASHSIEGAFLPPDETARDILLQEYPAEIHEFLATHKPLIVANAAHCMIIDGKDIYGLDMCVELMRALCAEFSDVGLLLVLGSIGNETYFAKILHRICEYNLVSHIYIVHGNRLLWPLLSYADIFVRPTVSDGASVSIQEALYFHVPVIASDVCKRPSQVISFECHNVMQFIKCTKATLQYKKIHNCSE